MLVLVYLKPKNFIIAFILLHYVCAINADEQLARISAKKCAEYTEKLYEPGKIPNGPHVLKCPRNTTAEPETPPLQHAAAKEFPHFALIGYEKGNANKPHWACVGTLISEVYVLTSGNCVINNTILGLPQYVLLGDLDTDSEQDDAAPIQLNITGHIPHPDFTSSNKYNNIGLLKLEKPVTFSEYIRPACLPDTDVNVPVLIGSSWDFHDKRKYVLKAVLKVYEHPECQNAYSSHKLPRGIDQAIQFCAAYLSPQNDFSELTSGSPALSYSSTPCTAIVNGILSFGTTSTLIPEVYEKVFPYVTWIESVVWPSQ